MDLESRLGQFTVGKLPQHLPDSFLNHADLEEGAVLWPANSQQERTREQPHRLSARCGPGPGRSQALSSATQ